MYAELHTHSDIGSNVRLIDSTCTINKLIDTAVEYGFKGIAITDHESLSAHIKAIKKAQQIRSECPDFKLVLGNEIYLINETDYQNTDKFFHFLLLAKDPIGHKQLRILSTRAWSRVYTHKRVERVPTFYSDLTEIVGQNPGHLIASTACLGSYFDTLLLNEEYGKAKVFADWCVSVFGADNYFIEMQPGLTEDQKLYNQRAMQFCKANGYRWIFTNDIHYLTVDKRELHAAFLNSKDEERETGDFYENTYFKSEEEMIARMDYFDEQDIKTGFANTVKIIDSVEQYDLAQDVIVPPPATPDFVLQHIFKPWYEKYQYIKAFAYSRYEQDRYFLSLVENGFLKWKQPFTDETLSRIDIEIQQLWDISKTLNQRMSGYYNLVRWAVNVMWEFSLVGPARGSVTGFYTAFLLDIIQVNPLDWDLKYWRHLTAERPELPDVDMDSSSSQRSNILRALKERWGVHRALNIITFRTAAPKAAIKTACRGLGVDVDIANELAGLVPVVRGKAKSIRECVFGNAETGDLPIRTMVDIFEQHPGLLETTLEIENLVVGRGSHASGLYLFDGDYIEQNSLMKSPKGIETTCWDQGDSDYCGALKMDVLTIEALDRIQKAMDLLIADGKMEWQGTLRETYNKYLHPAVLDYDSQNMWDMLGRGEVVDVFQFQTQIGIEAIRKIKPRSLKELALSSSVMRLVGDGEIDPIDRFVKYKENIELWYEEMRQEGLSQSEVATLEKYLLRNYGNSIEQEDIMQLSMEEKIAGFNIVQSNKLRKIVSKKKTADIETMKAYFIECGRRQGTRDQMLNYVWNFCVKPQLGYAFSTNHTVPYSIIGLIEMNLVYRFPQIYWNTACLTINASANEDVEDNKSTNYGKIAKAIGDMQKRGVKVVPPDINTSRFEFAPDEINNQIIFGLKGINGVGDDVAKQIIDNRPYTSLLHFLEQNNFETGVVIKLIKAGCFDKIE